MIPAFSISPLIAAKYQDAIAAHMLAALPQRPARNLPSKATRIPPPSQEGNAAQIAKRAAERRAMIPVVMQMKREGMLQREIARELKISVDRLRVIIQEAGR